MTKEDNLANIHWKSACKSFAQNHKLESIAKNFGASTAQLRNKLESEQPHGLTVTDLIVLTKLTGDTTLIDGLIKQMDLLPSLAIPPKSGYRQTTLRMLKLVADTGHIASEAIYLIAGEKFDSQRKNNINWRIQNSIANLMWFNNIFDDDSD
ncbi:phage regulatory CII family protein [Sodalis sp. RH19]|uniref:phage regulatory CII family protein n=1 Tax=Sodalis sp. RH19 TaxID=3394334 RepID=UPI0039B55395